MNELHITDPREPRGRSKHTLPAIGDRIVLVVGRPAHARPVVEALRARGLLAWASDAPRVARDAASLEWADGVVMIDTAAEVDGRGLRLLRKARGASLLATSAPLGGQQRLEILESGVDVVEAWPTSPEVIAARVARLLHTPPIAQAAAQPERERRSA